MFKWMKKVFYKFIADIAKENEKQFGREKMDCCKLNAKQKR
jgi:hypothetical protein